MATGWRPCSSSSPGISGQRWGTWQGAQSTHTNSVSTWLSPPRWRDSPSEWFPGVGIWQRRWGLSLSRCRLGFSAAPRLVWSPAQYSARFSDWQCRLRPETSRATGKHPNHLPRPACHESRPDPARLLDVGGHLPGPRPADACARDREAAVLGRVLSAACRAGRAGRIGRCERPPHGRHATASGWWPRAARGWPLRFSRVADAPASCRRGCGCGAGSGGAIDGRGVTAALGRSRAAVVMAFVVNGVMFGSWASRIPAIKEQAGLDSAELGFAILGASIGAVFAMTFAGYVSGRFGSHVVTWLMLLGCAVMLPVIAASTSFLALAGSLTLFGAAQGSMDVSMNTNGMAVERAGTRPIMSRLHASWSIGSFLGAVSTTIALQAGLSVFEQFAILAVGLVLASVVLSRTLLPEKHAAEGPALRRPPRRLVVLGLVALCGLVAEGSAGDWSGIFVKDSLGGSAQDAAIAITVFSAATGSGR